MRKLEANPYEIDGAHIVTGVTGGYVYDGPPLGDAAGWSNFLPPPTDSGDATFVLPSVQAAGATPEDPDAKAILAETDPTVILARKTFHPGRGARESYTEREEFLKKWRG